METATRQQRPDRDRFHQSTGSEQPMFATLMHFQAVVVNLQAPERLLSLALHYLGFQA